MIVELPVGKSRYKITADPAEKERLFHLAEKLNQRVNQLSLSLKHADEKTLLVIAALMIQEELERKGVAEEHIEEQEDETPRLNEQDMYDAVSENMENVADYIEKLSKKIRNY